MDGRTIPLNKTLPRDLCPGGSRRTRPMTRTILSYPMLRLSRLPLDSSPFLFASAANPQSGSPSEAINAAESLRSPSPSPIRPISKKPFVTIRSIRRLWSIRNSVEKKREKERQLCATTDGQTWKKSIGVDSFPRPRIEAKGFFARGKEGLSWMVYLFFPLGRTRAATKSRY